MPLQDLINEIKGVVQEAKAASDAGESSFFSNVLGRQIEKPQEQEQVQQHYQPTLYKPVWDTNAEPLSDQSNEKKEEPSVVAEGNKPLSPEEWEQDQARLEQEAIKQHEQSLQPAFESGPVDTGVDEGFTYDPYYNYTVNLGSLIPDRKENVDTGVDEGFTYNPYYNYKINPSGAVDLLGDVLSTQNERRRSREREQYREENPMDENAMVNGLTSDEYKQKYLDLWNSQGGLEKDYVNGLTRLGIALSEIDPQTRLMASEINPDITVQPTVSTAEALRNIENALGVMSDDSYDDGTLRAENVKSKYMPGWQYKQYVNAGFGGRPIEDIDDNATYNKLDEMREYNFIPYIEDEEQKTAWDATQIADDITKAYNLFGDTRSRVAGDFTNINYGDQAINREQFYDELQKWWNNAKASEGSIPNLEYKQIDGSDVSLAPDQVQDLLTQLKNGTADIDYAHIGPFNFGKEASDNRKEITDMIADGDIRAIFSDLPGYTADLLFGSAPLFFAPTAWPQAISNAVSAAQGLDPRQYDRLSGTYSRYAGLGDVPDNPDEEREDYSSGERYLANILLSGLVPATERIAGGIGGSGGFIGRPIQEYMKKNKAPGWARAAFDVGGEGLEEVVASAWENYQTSGWDNWFANPIYETDENGNIKIDPVTGEPIEKYDTSGHSIQDPNTSTLDRIANFISQAPENFLGGALLGGMLQAPRILSDRLNNTGYFEDQNNRYRYRVGGPDDDYIEMTPDMIGTYNKRREE